jgi:hypothetical protein
MEGRSIPVRTALYRCRFPCSGEKKSLLPPGKFPVPARRELVRSLLEVRLEFATSSVVTGGILEIPC